MHRLAKSALLFLAITWPAVSPAADRAVTLQVDNMSCESCPLIVKKSLARVPGVKRVEVSFPKKSAFVTYDDVQTTTAALVDATTKAGFPSHASK